MSRRILCVVALLVGSAQPMLAAGASFEASAGAGAAVAAHTLAAPALSCSGGGLLSTAITLTWPQVASAATPDPYATPPNATYLADGYQIERATGAGAFAALATKARTATSHVDNPGGLVTTHRYRIRTTKVGWTSAWSNEVNATVTSILFVGVSSECP
jgi:hypothetical protein